MYWAVKSMPMDVDEMVQAIFSAEEIEELTGFRFQRRRDDWLIGRLTAKLIYLQSPDFDGKVDAIRSVSVRNEADGAPYFFSDEIGRIPGCLSISHRDQKALCAWTADVELRLGADIEKVEPRGDIPLEEYFTAQEQSTVQSLRPVERDAWITRAWSIKEAVLKGMGIGLRVDPRRVEVVEIEEKTGESDPGWKAFKVNYPTEGWNGFWQRQGDFILTIAGAHRLQQRWQIVEIQ